MIIVATEKCVMGTGAPCVYQAGMCVRVCVVRHNLSLLMAVLLLEV